MGLPINIGFNPRCKNRRELAVLPPTDLHRFEPENVYWLPLSVNNAEPYLLFTPDVVVPCPALIQGVELPCGFKNRIYHH